MTSTCRNLILGLCLAIAAPLAAAAGPAARTWDTLEFEETAYWATARSRIELPVPAAGQNHATLTADSSVPGNSEHLDLGFNLATGQLEHVQRVSKGKEDQRLKSFRYEKDYILRERRMPGADPAADPADWRVISRKRVHYPASAKDLPVTNPYLLLLLADQLQSQGPGATLEVLVHTDFNFYRARLNSGNGVPVQADVSLGGDKKLTGERDTTAVVLRVSPEGDLAEADDFSLLGLHGDIIILFDSKSGLPLQVRGQAPRIGATEINLKSASLRDAG